MSAPSWFWVLAAIVLIIVLLWLIGIRINVG